MITPRRRSAAPSKRRPCHARWKPAGHRCRPASYKWCALFLLRREIFAAHRWRPSWQCGGCSPRAKAHSHDGNLVVPDRHKRRRRSAMIFERGSFSSRRRARPPPVGCARISGMLAKTRADNGVLRRRVCKRYCRGMRAGGLSPRGSLFQMDSPRSGRRSEAAIGPSSAASLHNDSDWELHDGSRSSTTSSQYHNFSATLFSVVLLLLLLLLGCCCCRRWRCFAIFRTRRPPGAELSSGEQLSQVVAGRARPGDCLVNRLPRLAGRRAQARRRLGITRLCRYGRGDSRATSVNQTNFTLDTGRRKQ
jgi:hypothetical protein